MNKLWKKTLTWILAAMFVFSGIQSAFASINISGPGYDNVPHEMLMDDVGITMLNASNWTAFPGAGLILMNDRQIKELNEKCLDTSACCMNRLEAIGSAFNGVKMRTALASFSDPENLFLNGAPVPSSYYQSVRANIAGAPVQENMVLGYAISLKRCMMKSLPSPEDLSDDVTDPEWDNLVLTSVQYNEPLVVYFTTADGKYAYVKSVLCDGWVPTDCIVLCHDKEEWKKAYDPEKYLIVTGDRIQTEMSYVQVHSELTLEMGVKLELCDDGTQTVDNRMNWCNYVVYAPGRGADGLYEKQKMLIPAGSDVNVGYLPMTQKNIVSQAFKSLGTRYGWGGSMNAQDCSLFVRDVYSCFGLCLPRNTTWQGAMPVEKVDLSKMTDEQKKRALRDLPVGTILQFPGHEMLYLGEQNGKFYTINDVSSLAVDTETGLKKVRVRSVVVNSLEGTKRVNGKTWLNQLTNAIIVFR